MHPILQKGLETMPQAALDYEALSDCDLNAFARDRDPDAVRLITRRNNQRLFRAAWSILKNRADAEEAVQDTYLKAFAGAAPYAGGSSLSTWLTRIVINESLGRRRTAERRQATLDRNEVIILENHRDSQRAPDSELLRTELSRALEAAIAQLPEVFRTVLILRDIEDMSIEDTAAALGIPSQTVKSRLSRARARLRDLLDPQLRTAMTGAFRFAGADCDRLTQRALNALCP